LAKVRPNSAGAGRPSSTRSVPALASTMFALWLPPKVWLHGSQSSSTGGSAARNGQTTRIIRWFAQSIRWVFSTPFGPPVDPEVNRIFATVSGPTAAQAASTSALGAVAARASYAVLPPAPDSVTASVPTASATTASAPA
jgi:hypothetical protein